MSTWSFELSTHHVLSTFRLHSLFSAVSLRTSDVPHDDLALRPLPFRVVALRTTTNFHFRYASRNSARLGSPSKHGTSERTPFAAPDGIACFFIILLFKKGWLEKMV